MEKLKINPQDIYSYDTLNKVTQILNGFMFHNGRGKSDDQISEEMKDLQKTIFADFYGKFHKDIVEEKIDSANIVFIKHICGKKFSIESLLKEIRSKQITLFKQKHSIPYSTCTSALYEMTIKKLICDESEITDDLREVLTYFKIPVKDFLTKFHTQLTVKTKLNKMIDEFLDLTPYYSYDQQINSDCLFLEKFMNVYIRATEESAKKLLEYLNYDNIIYSNPIEFLEEKMLGPNSKKYLNMWKKFTNSDPLFQFSTNYCDENSKLNKVCLSLLNPESKTRALCLLQDSLIFGTNINDQTVIHEFNHWVDESGFEKLQTSKKVPDSYGNDAIFRKLEAFNEIVNDWFAKLMYDKYFSHHHNFCKGPLEKSLYSTGFPLLSRFLGTFLPELKQARLSSVPARYFSQLIGKENFEELSQLSLDILSLSHPTNDMISTNTDIDWHTELINSSEQLRTTSNEIAMKEHLMRYIVTSVEQEPRDFPEVIRQAVGYKFDRILNSVSLLLENLPGRYKAKRYKDESFDESENDQNTKSVE